MTMYGGDRDDDAEENEWLNAPLTDPDEDLIHPAVVSWLDMLRQNDDPSWDAIGGNELIEDGEIDGVPMTPEQMVERQADIIREEWSPTTLRNFILNEYYHSDEEARSGDQQQLGSGRFRDDVEEHIMGYPQNWNRTVEGRDRGGLEQDEEFQEWMRDNDKINFTSKDPLFTASADTIFDTVWGMMKSVEKGKFRGYTRNRISGRAERQGKARAWSQSRKVKRGRTRKRYARNKKRGNVRPQMRRQLGAGGKREQVKR